MQSQVEPRTSGGALVRPDHIPIDIFLNEITFYRLNLETISEFLEIEGLLNPTEDEKGKRLYNITHIISEMGKRNDFHFPFRVFFRANF